MSFKSILSAFALDPHRRDDGLQDAARTVGWFVSWCRQYLHHLNILLLDYWCLGII